MPGVDFARLREQVAMSDVLRLLNFAASSAHGDQLRGPCPLHAGGADGRSRSFSVNLRLGRFHCFVCGEHGNALELWSSARRVSLYAAAKE